MEVRLTVPVQKDGWNTYPPDMAVTINEETVTLELYDRDREITIDKQDFLTIVKYVQIT